MADETLDLLGDPIPDGWGEPGRPPHNPTPKNRQKVMLLLALDRKNSDIARALGIDAKTLRKHYSRELAARRSAELRLEGALLTELASEAAAGNVAANKELDKRLQRHKLAALSDRVADRGRDKTKAEPMGIKAQRAEAAKQVGGKFAPPAGPTLN